MLNSAVISLDIQYLTIHETLQRQSRKEIPQLGSGIVGTSPTEESNEKKEK